MIYNITRSNYSYYNEKYEKQKQFIKYSYIVSKNQNETKIISLKNVVRSANFSKKYIAELNNKVNVFNNLLLDNEKLVNVFCTCTLESFYRDFYYNNYFDVNFYSKYNDFKYLPSDFLKKINNREDFTVKDFCNVFKYRFNLFKKYLLRHTKQKIDYFFTFEPHKTGFPHCHFVFQIEKQYLNIALNIYKKLFSARQNLRYNDENELNGFQTKIKSSLSYLMKYLNKQVVNVNNENCLNSFHIWFKKYKIYRLTHSRFLFPITLYRKVIFVPFLRDLKKLSSIKDNFLKYNDYKIYFFDNFKLIFNECKKLFYYVYCEENQSSIINYYNHYQHTYMFCGLKNEYE